MNVVLVTHGVKDLRTAVYRNMSNRANFLRNAGYDAHVITPTDLGWNHGRLVPLWYPFAVAVYLLRHAPPHAVLFQSHTGWVYQLVRSRFAAHRRTRVAVAFHGVDIMYVRALSEELARSNRHLTRRFRLAHAYLLPALCAWSCRRADRVFCLNSEEERFLLDNRWTTRASLSLLPHCTRKLEFLSRVHATGASVRLLTIAQWLPIKGTRYLVEAFTMLVRSGRDVTLTCGGTGKSAQDVLQEFPEDVRARVRVVTAFNPADVGELTRNADVFVLPSVFEAFGMVVLEAMAAGLPIVATATGGPKDMLRAGEDALLVPVADARALAGAIENLVDDPHLRIRLGDNVRRKLEAYSCERVLPRFAAELLGVDVAVEIGVA